VFIILVINNVPSRQGCLRQKIGQLFFLQGEFFEARYVIAQNLDIGETIDLCLDILCRVLCIVIPGNVAFHCIICSMGRCLFLATGCK